MNKLFRNRQNSGITLVALVITIIVLLILAGVSIATLTGTNGILTQAQKSKMTTELSSYKEQLELYKTEKLSENREFLESTLTVGKESLTYNTQPTGETGNIKTVIPNIKDEYIDKIEVIKGALLINTQDKNEIEIAKSLGIAANPYDIVNGELLSSNGNLLLMDETGTLTIPDSVTKIGEGALANLDGLKTIIIPGTVKEIWANAFAYNKTLETVIMKEGVEIIGDSAFANCSKLVTVDFPESITNIGGDLFFQCGSLEKMEIPSKVVSLYGTFGDCHKLREVTFRGNNINTIGTNTFGNCEVLDNLVIPEYVENINGTAFNNCKKLNNITVKSANFIYEDGMLMNSNKNKLIFLSSKYYSDKAEMTIPEGMLELNVYMNFNNIRVLKLPSSLKKINCENFPKNIENVIIDSNNTAFKVIGKCIYTTDNEKLVWCYSKEETITLINDVKIIGKQAFEAAINAKNITIPDSTESIEELAFSACSKIETINIGKNVSEISPLFKYSNYSGNVKISEENKFYTVEDNILYNKNKEKLCAVLYKIEGTFILNDKVKEIGTQAFYAQYYLKNIVLNNVIETIGGSAFGFCVNLIKIEIPSTIKEIHMAFESCNNLEEIKIHKSKNSITGAPWGAKIGDRAIIWEE